jgi:hypothetical protein
MFPLRPAFQILVLLLLLSQSFLHAGGGPSGFVVVYDPTDIRSVTTANRYQQLRGIPERNMIPYAFPEAIYRREMWDFIYFLRQTLADRGLDEQLEGIAIAGAASLSSGHGQNSFLSLLYSSPNYGEINAPTATGINNSAFRNTSLFNGPSPAGSLALTANTDFSGSKYWPVSFLGHHGLSGNTPREILALLERSKLADGAKPSGTIYWPLTSDVRSTTRQSQLQAVTAVWDARGIKYQITGSPTTSAASANAWVSNRSDISGGIVGTQLFTNKNNTFLAGSWVDHLTSFGGNLNVFNASQTPAVSWLRAGAYGSSGTFAEPYAIAAKFPHAHIHTHFRAGSSLVEAFWQSISSSAEILCFGDPLMQPYADFPEVVISSPANGATLSGQLVLLADAVATGGNQLEPNLDLFVDGRRIAIGEPDEPVSAQRLANGFSLNTTTLSDGWHDVRVVAYNANSVRTQGEDRIEVMVNNSGQSIALTGPSTVNPELGGNFTITPSGLSDLTSLELRANGRTLATVPVGGGTATVTGASVARQAPLDGEWTLYAVGIRSNGEEVSSAPLTTTIVWPPLPAVPNPPLGGSMARIKFFDNTRAAGFDWETTTPTVETDFAGHSNGTLEINSTNVPGVTISSYTNRPGYEVSFWFYAPVDDWYEFAATYQYSKALKVNGVVYPDRFGSIPPVHLAAGWHSVAFRFALPWEGASPLWVRGGSSRVFQPINRSMAANTGSGLPAETPSILGVTPLTPVTGTTRALTANATVGGGTLGELAGLTYHWSVIPGPDAFPIDGAPGDPGQGVTFSANHSNAAQNTTVTFQRAGLHVLQLVVRGPAGSALTTFAISVEAVASSNLQLAWVAGQQALRGLPLDLYAYSVDQFGTRMDVTPVNPSAPTIQWTTTDPAGTITLKSPTGDLASYRSLSAVSANQSFTITATGVNGRTGSVTSPSLTVVTNAAPAFSQPSLPFSIYQSAFGQPLTLTAQVTDAETSATSSGLRIWNAQLLTYAWSVISAPAGQSLSLNSTTSSSVTATPSGPGTYVVQLTVTDQAGASITGSNTIEVSGTPQTYFTSSAISAPSLGSITSIYVGETLQLLAPYYSQSYQWQVSVDGGGSWQSIPNVDGQNYVLGPLTTADSNKQFRYLVAIDNQLFASPSLTLPTVLDPDGGVAIMVGSIGSSSLDVPTAVHVGEGDGTVQITFRRSGKTNSAGSLTYTIPSWRFSSLPYSTQGSDYLQPLGEASYTGTVSWAVGDSADKTITIPIVDDAEIEGSESLLVLLSSATGMTRSSANSSRWIVINDNDGPGRAEFLDYEMVANETDGTLQIPVRRVGATQGNLTVDYSAASDTAVSGQDYELTQGSLTWADGDVSNKWISVALIKDTVVEGTERFIIRLSDPGLDYSESYEFLGEFPEMAIDLQDAPYQQWQRTWWANSLPEQALFESFAAALRLNGPFFHLRFSELTGTSVVATDQTQQPVFSGTLGTNGGAGAISLGQAGPRPLVWSGLEETNTGLSMTSTSSNGGFVTLASTPGIGSNLGNGFTISAFVKTSVTDRQMALLSGATTGSYGTTANTQMAVTLNRNYTAPSAVTPHSLHITLQPQTNGPTALIAAVTLKDLPTGSLCDGQWHHIAISVPAFTNTNPGDSPTFYFDGQVVPAQLVRGTEGISTGQTFLDFSGVGMRVGANSSTSPSSFFHGSVDEVAFFTRPLTAGEISTILEARSAQPAPTFTDPETVLFEDGVPNLLKYALGLNPLLPASPSDLPTAVLNGNALEFQFFRVRGATDVVYKVQQSLTLQAGSWTDLWKSSDYPYPDTSERMIETISLDLLDQPKVFLRLEVIRQN